MSPQKQLTFPNNLEHLVEQSYQSGYTLTLKIVLYLNYVPEVSIKRFVDNLMLIELNLWSRLHFKYNNGETLLMNGCCFILFRVKIVWDIVCVVYWCFELDMVLHYQSVTLSILVQWCFCLAKNKPSIKAIFSWRVHWQQLVKCFNRMQRSWCRNVP